MFKLLHRKKNYSKPIRNNSLSKISYWKFALTDTHNLSINQKINESRHKSKSTSSTKIYNITSLANVHSIVTNIYNNSHESYKIHISFGYVFMNKKTGDVTANSPSTKFYFNKPQTIKFESDLNKLLSKINDHSVKSEIHNLLPNTQSQLMGIYSLGVKIYKLGYKVGTCINLPDHIIKSRRIISLNNVENNLLFWAACALMHGARKDKYIT